MQNLSYNEFKNSKSLKICIITLSDRAFKGEYADLSGAEIETRITEYFTALNWKITTERILIPDDAELLKKEMQAAKANATDILFTTGGTGIGPRDITPDVVKPLLDKEIPGIMEFIRVKYGANIPNALLSRAVAGLMNNTLVYTLPGSVKAVKEYLTEILNTLEHLILMQYSIQVH